MAKKATVNHGVIKEPNDEREMKRIMVYKTEHKTDKFIHIGSVLAELSSILVSNLNHKI